MGAERILVVDDEPTARRAFARSMRQHGFVIDLAKDGEEAWELAQHFPYAVVATDLSMPGMDGMMLIHQLREVQPDTVCLLVTGYRQVGALDAANVEVITKPWSDEQLAEALRQAVAEYRRRTREFPAEESLTPPIRPRVLSLGLDEHRQKVLHARLESDYDVIVVAPKDLQAELESEVKIACCFIPDGRGCAALVRQLSRTAPLLPLVAVGREFDEARAREAIRAGALDWLAVDQLSAAELRRVTAVAAARSPSNQFPAYAPRTADALLQERLRQALGRAKRGKTRAGLLRVNLNGGEKLERAVGQQAADALVEKVAYRLRASVREGDGLVRLQDDAFALILEDLADRETIKLPIQRVLNALATPFSLDGAQVMLTASIGAAVYPDHSEDAAGLVAIAERARQAAQTQGENQSRVGPEALSSPSWGPQRLQA